MCSKPITITEMCCDREWRNHRVAAGFGALGLNFVVCRVQMLGLVCFMGLTWAEQQLYHYLVLGQ